MEVKEIEHVLIFVQDWELAAVELIECASLRLKQEAHHQSKHQDMQVFILVQWSFAPLTKIERLFRKVLRTLFFDALSAARSMLNKPLSLALNQLLLQSRDILLGSILLDKPI